MLWPSRAWAYVWDRMFPGSRVYPAEAAPDRDQILVNASQPSSILKHGIKANATEHVVSLRIGSQVRLRTQGSAPTAHQDSLSPEDFDDRESSPVMRTKSNFWSGIRMNPPSNRTSLTGETCTFEFQWVKHAVGTKVARSLKRLHGSQHHPACHGLGRECAGLYTKCTSRPARY